MVALSPRSQVQDIAVINAWTVYPVQWRDIRPKLIREPRQTSLQEFSQTISSVCFATITRARHSIGPTNALTVSGCATLFSIVFHPPSARITVYALHSSLGGTAAVGKRQPLVVLPPHEISLPNIRSREPNFLSCKEFQAVS
jgi:hypothetical protein